MSCESFIHFVIIMHAYFLDLREEIFLKSKRLSFLVKTDCEIMIYNIFTSISVKSEN